jgi:WW domain-binding protein 11
MAMPRVLGLQIQIPGLPPPPPVPTSASGICNAQKTPNVLSAAPQLINVRKDKDSGKSSTTIEAKPQIRNLAADITRFLPTSLRVKRLDDKKKPSVPIPAVRIPERISIDPPPIIKPMQQLKTKDDAYLQFMQEMQGLL